MQYGIENIRKYPIKTLENYLKNEILILKNILKDTIFEKYKINIITLSDQQNVKRLEEIIEEISDKKTYDIIQKKY